MEETNMRRLVETTILLLAAMATGYLGSLLGQNNHPVQAQIPLPAVQEVVRANRFELVDTKGRLRGSFASGNDGSITLCLNDSAGKSSVALGVTAENIPLVALTDMAGKTRMTLGVRAGGGPGMWLVDAAGKIRSAIAVEDNGAPSLALYDTAGTVRGLLAVGTDGSPALKMHDAAGRIRGQFAIATDGIPGIATEGMPGISLYDSAGKLRGVFAVISDNEGAALGMYDKGGDNVRLLWERER